jgi:hypothetical protein
VRERFEKAIDVHFPPPLAGEGRERA